MRTGFFILIAALGWGCGGSGGGAAAPVASAQLDATGGTVMAPDGALGGAGVVVPPDALTEPTTITIAAGTNVAAGAGTAGVGPAVRFGPSEAAFDTPVTVTIPFSTAQAGGADVRIAQRDDGTGAVTIHTAVTVDAGAGTVSVDVSGFSTFQAFVEVSAPAFDATGIWVVELRNNFTDPPGFEDPEEVVLVEIVQNGSDVTMIFEGTATGTVDGAQYTLTEMATDGTEMRTETLSFTLSSADAGTGTQSFDTTNDGVTFSGGADLTLTRQQPATFDVAGTWDITLSNNFSDPPGNEDDDETITFPFTQSGLSWTFTGDSGTHTGFLSGASYYVFFEEIDSFGNDVEVWIEFVLSGPDAGTGEIRWEENGGAVRGGADLSFAR